VVGLDLLITYDYSIYYLNFICVKGRFNMLGVAETALVFLL
jgi:hypothetical protein